ncbi:pyrroline-5-carboxylate reductase [bacterium]|nr:pyrroline-5-carboxylate reductase [bacterium]
MRVGVIGVGTIGEIFAERLSKEGHELFAYDVRDERLKEITNRYGLRKAASNAALIESSEVIVVAVKPQVFPSVVKEMKEATPENRLFISVLAGVETRRYEEEMPGVKVVRIMPNIPIQIGKGVIAISRGKNVTEKEEEDAAKLLSPLGVIERVPEEKIDAVTALSGSGPGFVFAIVEALADAGVQIGLSYPQSLRMVARMMAGSAEMIEKTGKHPAELRNKVCSPAGTTIEGMLVLEEMGIRGILMEAVSAAYKRAKELM